MLSQETETSQANANGDPIDLHDSSLYLNRELTWLAFNQIGRAHV